MRLYLVSLLAALLAGCSLVGASAEERQLADARARWASVGPDSYVVTFARSCYCPADWVGPFEVTVTEGRVTRVTRDGADVPLGLGATVEDVFRAIERALGGGGTALVTYDATTGMPLQADFDPIRNAADDEMGYALSNLRPR